MVWMCGVVTSCAGSDVAVGCLAEALLWSFSDF